jgi:epoxyqueuosine reductase
MTVPAQDPEPNNLSSALKAHARELGADLYGVASIDRFDELNPDRHPRAIFPEAQSVLVIGKRITRGALRGIEEGTQFQLYHLYGRDWLNNRVLATATLRVAQFLEDSGWEAVPLPNLPPETPAMGVSVRPDQPAPNVMLDFDDAAVRAGVGEIGYCGLLITPQFGPRQRLQVILTDAALRPDPILEKAVCDRSREHAAFCPLGAINPEAEHVVSICGKEMRVAGIDYAKCATCKNGATPNPHHPSGRPDRMAALCTRSCIQYLEENGRLLNTFHHPFRKRPPWGVIEERRSL